jgi:hypothetical protein
MDINNFYKNSELAEEFGVSSMTISRYIDAAKLSLNDLELIKSGDTYKIKKTELNNQIIKLLVNDKSKFKNPPRYRTLTPGQEFEYKYTLNTKMEIARDLKNLRLINSKFAYLGNNNIRYIEYQKSRKKNQIRAEILNNQLSFFSEYARIKKIKYSITELGPIDLISTQEFLTNLSASNFIENYAALDISNLLMKESEEIINSISSSINYSHHVIDIEQEDLYEVLFDNKYNSNSPEQIINLFLIIGTTTSNFHWPNRVYRNISDSLVDGDFLVVDLIKEYPEIEKNKIYEPDSLFYKFIISPLKDLGFEDEDISIQSIYDKTKNIRKVVAILNDNINLKLDFMQEQIEFKKGSEILLSINRVDYSKEIELIQKYDFELISMQTSINLDYVNCVFKKIASS